MLRATGHDMRAWQVTACQTLSGPLPQSGSPAREARGAAAAPQREIGPQCQASHSAIVLNA